MLNEESPPLVLDEGCYSARNSHGLSPAETLHVWSRSSVSPHTGLTRGGGSVRGPLYPRPQTRGGGVRGSTVRPTPRVTTPT